MPGKEGNHQLAPHTRAVIIGTHLSFYSHSVSGTHGAALQQCAWDEDIHHVLRPRQPQAAQWKPIKILSMTGVGKFRLLHGLPNKKGLIDVPVRFHKQRSLKFILMELMRVTIGKEPVYIG